VLRYKNQTLVKLMDNIEHTHRLRFPWWFRDIVSGSCFLVIVIEILILNAQDLISGGMGISNYLGIAALMFTMVPVGLFFFSSPFITKIVIKSDGLEYHTPAYILLADWKDLINTGYVKNTQTGKSWVVVPQGGILTLRAWAQPFQRFLRHNPKEVVILISQFRATNGHSLETDILANVSQRGELSTELLSAR
jgi:hypothetical protein